MNEDLIRRLVGSVAQDVIGLSLSELEAESGQKLRASIRVKYDDEWTGIIQFPEFSDVGSNTAHMEIRILLRQAFAANRYLFKIETIVHDLAAQTGYSGFETSGDIKERDGKLNSNANVQIHRYNNYQWSSKFRIDSP